MNKWVKIITWISPVVVAAGGVGTYYAINKVNDSSNASGQMAGMKSSNGFKEEDNLYDGVKVFPTLKTRDIYKYVRMNENVNPYISDDMISQIVKEIISKASISDNNIHWTYNLLNENKELEIFFWWIDPFDHRHSKKYNIVVKNKYN